MTRLLPGLPAITLVLAGAALLCAACEDKKATESSPSADAGTSTDKYALADPKLTKALQAAAASASATGENGPPPQGIFPPGLADKRHPKGAPTTVDIVGDGNEPRITLTGVAPDVARTSSYGPAALELGMLTGPRMVTPTIDLGLSLGPAKKEDGGSDWLVGDVKKAVPAKEQLGELPPGTDKAVGSLVGTQVRVKLSAEGYESDLQADLAKEAVPDTPLTVAATV